MLSEAKQSIPVAAILRQTVGFLAPLSMTTPYRIGLISRKLVPIDKE